MKHVFKVLAIGVFLSAGIAHAQTDNSNESESEKQTMCAVETQEMRALVSTRMTAEDEMTNLQQKIQLTGDRKLLPLLGTAEHRFFKAQTDENQLINQMNTDCID